MRIEAISDQDFARRVRHSEKAVLVGFLGKKSATNRFVKTFLHATANELAERAEIYEMNAETNPATAATYRIASLPTLLIFKKGRFLSSYVGAVSRTTISQLLAVSL